MKAIWYVLKEVTPVRAAALARFHPDIGCCGVWLSDSFNEYQRRDATRWLMMFIDGIAVCSSYRWETLSEESGVALERVFWRERHNWNCERDVFAALLRELNPMRASGERPAPAAD